MTSAPHLVIKRCFHSKQGVAFPAMQGAWGLWAPPLERSTLVSMHVAGASLGSVIVSPIAAVIITSYGWEAVFYFTGLFEEISNASVSTRKM